MLFSIAIPVYNNKKSIKRAVESAQKQTLIKDFEILIVDNNSNDGTSKIIKDLAAADKRVVIIKNPKTIAMYDNHNICLQKAKGEYILFCHADDYLLPNALSILDDKIRARNFPKRYVVWGRSLFRDFYPNWLFGETQLDTILSGLYAFRPFYYGGLTPSGTCYSRKEFVKIGGFIKAQHKLAPSDMATMLLLAVNNFEFEMMSRILFIRREANTAKNVNQHEMRKAVTEAILNLKSKTSNRNFSLIVNQCFKQNLWPTNFQLGLFNLKICRFKVVKYVLKQMCFHPLFFFKKIYFELLKSN